MRVLYDISTLGLGHRYLRSRGGSYRADQHLAAGLLASKRCELIFCANHSSVAYQGCIEYLRADPQLGVVQLLGRQGGGIAVQLQRAIAAAHRCARRMLGHTALPMTLRRGGALFDRRVHQPVCDASPPVDVFHSAATPLPVRPAGRSPKRLLTIYDVRHIRLPAMYGRAYSQVAQAALDSVGGDDWVMTSSESNRAALCEYGVAAPDRVFVSSLAADRRLFYPCDDTARVQAVRKKYGIPDGPYILSMNTPDPRKNMRSAVLAFSRLLQQEHIRDLTFVLVGETGPTFRRHDPSATCTRAVRERIVMTGYVEDSELSALYSGAIAFVYPSLYEGFGLPPLEAMQCGTPVITSNTSSMPEVVGEAGIMVSPQDIDALCAAILKLYRVPSARVCLREKSLARAARFSWERTVEQTLAAYRAVMWA